MVVLERDAAARRGLYIYTFAPFSGQTDFVIQNPAFVATPLSQNPSVLLPPQSVCLTLSARTADGEASPFPTSDGRKGITH